MKQSKVKLQRPNRKEKTGVVISSKMNKTIVVQVERHAKHPIYNKVVRKTKNFFVHDEEQKAKVGDKVKIVETRPLSKLKRWRLVEVLK